MRTTPKQRRRARSGVGAVNARDPPCDAGPDRTQAVLAQEDSQRQSVEVDRLIARARVGTAARDGGGLALACRWALADECADLVKERALEHIDALVGEQRLSPLTTE